MFFSRIFFLSERFKEEINFAVLVIRTYPHLLESNNNFGHYFSRNPDNPVIPEMLQTMSTAVLSMFVIKFNRYIGIFITFVNKKPIDTLVVAMSMCLYVCLSLFMWYILRPILTPLHKVGCPKFLEIQNPGGKVLERSGLRIEHFCWDVV